MAFDDKSLENVRTSIGTFFKSQNYVSKGLKFGNLLRTCVLTVW